MLFYWNLATILIHYNFYCPDLRGIPKAGGTLYTVACALQAETIENVLMTQVSRFNGFRLQSNNKVILCTISPTQSANNNQQQLTSQTRKQRKETKSRNNGNYIFASSIINPSNSFRYYE